ncbi:BrnT family toxin [Devosia aurantiaca]|uniref:BrnT family toxin n=1 Tax=Devosia aurantiaca TaxID=2714858 RepID=A0A6M1SRQ4_9HYPH|nr:BrnT family toxin [Devosia aurantiaca]NGP18062.1 BrnT family toxin [Devosia aurantiaca]
MAIEFDEEKDRTNIVKHQISLARAGELEILTVLEDNRFDYGEVRYRAWGLIDGETYCLVFTSRGGEVRAISLRRAHEKEMNRYVFKPEL